MIRLIIAMMFAPAAWFMQKINPGVRVLMYHRVTDLDEYDQLTVDVATFENQMASLSASSKVISLEQALEVMHDGKKLLRPRIVISFDDGYLDNLENALPILERYKLPAIIFITTNFADQSDSHPRYPAGDKALHLDWQQLRQLVKHPLISLGSHTLSHPYLQSVSNEQASSEILDSAEYLEKQLGVDVKYFCFPSGDYSARELQVLAGSSYKAAVTVAPGVNYPGKFSPFEIRRTEVTARDTGLMFKLKLLGALDMVHRLLHLRRKKLFQRQAESNSNDIAQQVTVDAVPNSGVKWKQ